MAKIKQKINITEKEDATIRRRWDIERGRWYFSVTDVMAVLTESVDARNYWKALKNRLKNSHNQLVMDCNQLKMTAVDGKSYLVDTADADTLLKIIQIIAPYNVPPFKSWFDHIEVSYSPKSENSILPKIEKGVEEDEKAHNTDEDQDEISTALEIPVDVLEEKNKIIVKTFLAGFDPNSLLISASMDTLTLKGSRARSGESLKVDEDDFLKQELVWGNFYRKIKLESLIDVDSVEATESHGLIVITLTKVDLEKTRFIKLKNL